MGGHDVHVVVLCEVLVDVDAEVLEFWRLGNVLSAEDGVLIVNSFDVAPDEIGVAGPFGECDQFSFVGVC